MPSHHHFLPEFLQQPLTGQHASTPTPPTVYLSEWPRPYNGPQGLEDLLVLPTIISDSSHCLLPCLRTHFLLFFKHARWAPALVPFPNHSLRLEHSHSTYLLVSSLASPEVSAQVLPWAKGTTCTTHAVFGIPTLCFFSFFKKYLKPFKIFLTFSLFSDFLSLNTPRGQRPLNPRPRTRHTVALSTHSIRKGRELYRHLLKSPAIAKKHSEWIHSDTEKHVLNDHFQRSF